jgi:hypothetical protein
MARAGNPCVVQYYATKAKNMNYKDLRHCRQLTFINIVRRRSGCVQMWTTGLVQTLFVLKKHCPDHYTGINRRSSRILAQLLVIDSCQFIPGNNTSQFNPSVFLSSLISKGVLNSSIVIYLLDLYLIINASNLN